MNINIKIFNGDRSHGKTKENFAAVPEHGHWGYAEYADEENCFHAENVIFE